MASLVTSDSWLVFQLLHMEGPHDWLESSCSEWTNFQSYKRIEEFAQNISITNDIAERGVRLITDYLNKTNSEEQRQALLQTVEYYRALVPDTKKESLKMC